MNCKKLLWTYFAPGKKAISFHNSQSIVMLSTENLTIVKTEKLQS